MRKKISVGLFHLFALAFSMFALGVAATLSFVLQEVLVVPVLSGSVAAVYAIISIVSSAKES
ncbi:TPA: hypothetical protein VDB83_005844 [Burkholderia cenocepacia]|nr:hypothetical protein [Burkholderia cenocepacia]